MMPGIIIECPSSDSQETKFMTLDGEPFEGVTKCTITILPNEEIRAEMSMWVTPTSIKANAMLSLETVREAAKLHGYELARTY